MGEGNETGGMLVVPDRGPSELEKEKETGEVPVATGSEEFDGGSTPLLGPVESGGKGIKPVPKLEVRPSVPERRFPVSLKDPEGVPVGTGSDTLSDVMMPLETVDSGGYGAGPVIEGKVSVAGNDVESDSVPDLRSDLFEKPALEVLVAPEV